MKRLYNALMLKKLLTLKELGVEYIEPIKKFKDDNVALPNSFNDLKDIAKNCHLCPLSKTRVNVVFGEGDINAKVMFIGEAPTKDDDIKGRVFVGRSGQLLTKMIENVLFIKRESVYISNIVKCRPANNKTPASSEALVCRAYLFKEIELVKPDIIVALGDRAYYYLTNDNTALSQIRGNIIDFNSSKLIATFHPSYLLRNPSAKKDAFADMLKVKEFLNKL